MRHRTIILCVVISATIWTPITTNATSQESKLERFARRISELEAINGDLERRLRFTQGRLEQALATLNGTNEPRSVDGAVPRRAVPRRAVPRRVPPVETGNRLLSRTSTEVARGLAVVSGSIKHAHKQALSGTLVIELYRDGFKIDEVSRPFEVPAYETVRYRQVFELEGYASGHYNARAGLIH